jgi:predicted nucleic acid-binding protein
VKQLCSRFFVVFTANSQGYLGSDLDDVLIAGQAWARGLVLASANVREFARIPELDVEDWSADPP